MAGLPEGGKVAWPPQDHEDLCERMRIWKAWYAGDPEMLAAIYGGGRGNTAAVSEFRFDTPRNHPAQYRGGVVGTVARMWWGKPIPPGDYPNKLHIPAASDLAVVSSQLLFSEAPRVQFGEDKATQKWWDDMASRSNLHAKLLQAAEVQAPYGGVYLVIAWDKEIADYPFIRPVVPDCAIPEFRWDVLNAVTFYEVVKAEKGKVWRHLERHERGRILHGLYLGDEKTLGWPAPLQALPETAMLQPQVETVPGKLTAAYIPNMLPNREDPRSYQGRSDYSPGLITLFDALDET
jgi:hypothetical protein